MHPCFLPPTHSVPPPTDFILSAHSQALEWGWEMTPSPKGPFQRVTRGFQPCLWIFKSSEQTVERGHFQVSVPKTSSSTRKIRQRSVSEGRQLSVYSILKPSPPCYLDDFVEFTVKGQKMSHHLVCSPLPCALCKKIKLGCF